MAGTTMAGEADLFSYDHESMAIEMAALDNLEEFVTENPSVSLSEMLASDNELASNMAETNAFYGFDLMNDRALGIGGFWWGCCLGPVGVVIVWLVADDPGETKKSIFGCIVSSLLGGGSSLYYNYSY
jgi:hypothetical protein